MKVGNHGDGFINPVIQPSGRVVSTPIPATPPKATVDQIKNFVDRVFPELTNAPIQSAKICWYCDARDGNFIIDHVPARPGLVVACGGSGHGFKFAPVIGDVIADVVLDKPNARRERFAWRTPGLGQIKTEACRLRTVGPAILTTSAHL